MKNYRAPLEPNKYYHVFNHAVGNVNLFIEDKNYKFFLEKFEKYMIEFVDVFAYCLMPNHFHFVMRIKNIDSSSDCQTTLKVSDSSGYSPISNAFKKLFTSYTNSFNKVYSKKGSLFQPRYKRLLIENESQLLNTIIYIHNNPVLHGFVSSVKDWNYSSYKAIIERKKTDWIKSSEVIDLFEDVSNFKFCHNRICEIDEIED